MKCSIRKFAFPAHIRDESYIDILDTETMTLSKHINEEFDPANWIIPNPDERYAIAYSAAAVEVFDSDSDININGFKLAKNCGHNAEYPNRYYREVDAE